VTTEGDDYFGDAVVEAARLCAAATGGQILVAAVTRASAGRRSAHTFVRLGGLDLKGLPEPLETYEVAWEPAVREAAAGHVPLPARLAHRPPVGVVGRDTDLEVLGAAAKRVAAGQGREILLVTGEPGQGKTTLVAEAARAAHDDGMVVLLGRCDESVGAPYAPFAEALGHYVAHADEELLRRYVDTHGAELSRLVPALNHRVGSLPLAAATDPDTERYVLFAAVVALLDAASAERGMMLLLDDLHWADKPTLQLLRHVVSYADSPRLMVTGTYRDAELSAAHPLTEGLAALRREPAVAALPLRGLDDAGVLLFLEAAAGHALDDDGVALAQAVYRETDGNPFFVTEVLRHLAETGAIVQDANGRWGQATPGVDIALPDSVRQVIGARLGRLGDPAEKVLSAAAVIGRDFEMDLVAAVTGVDEDALIDLFEAAQAVALVREVPGVPGRYMFSHALIQHTIYEDLGATRQARLHRLIGESLEQRVGGTPGNRVGELAHHYLHATRPADTDRAVTYARQAGEAALAALAPDEALRWFSQALEFASAAAEPGLRIDLLMGLGTAQRQTGASEFRETLLESAHLAQAAGDTRRLVEAALANSRGFTSVSGVIDEGRVDVLRAALRAVGDADTPERARLLARLCSELTYGPLEERMALAQEAKATARRLGDADTLVTVVGDCALSTRVPYTLEERFAGLREATELAEHAGDPLGQFFAAGWAFVDATAAGDFEFAERSLTVEVAISARLREPLMVWFSTVHEAVDALRRGQPNRAEELATRGFEVGTALGQPDAFTFYGSQLMIVRDQQGRLAELVDLIADVAAQNPGMPVYLAVLAWPHYEAGDQTKARDLIDAAAAEAFALPMDSAWLDGIISYASVATQLRLPERAEQLRGLLASYDDQVPCQGVTTREPIAMYLAGLEGVLGRYAEAERHFEKAAELCVRGEMHYAEAQNNLWWARMLADRAGTDDVERANRLADRASAVARAYGYPLVQARATALQNR
jgi:KaiC/GvpD/RAD55 family RecA-like ATPase